MGAVAWIAGAFLILFLIGRTQRANPASLVNQVAGQIPAPAGVSESSGDNFEAGNATVAGVPDLTKQPIPAPLIQPGRIPLPMVPPTTDVGQTFLTGGPTYAPPAPTMLPVDTTELPPPLSLLSVTEPAISPALMPSPGGVDVLIGRGPQGQYFYQRPNGDTYTTWTANA